MKVLGNSCILVCVLKFIMVDFVEEVLVVRDDEDLEEIFGYKVLV